MPSPEPLTTERLSALATEIETAVGRHAPGWPGPTTGDPGVTLLELLAYVADSLSGAQDRVSAESALASARSGFPTNASRHDPYRNFKFRVKWDGAYVAGVSRISGLGRVVQAVEYRDGAEPNVVRRVPGAVGYEAITLEREITTDTAFEDWANQIREHAAGAGPGAAVTGYLKNVRIEVLDAADRPAIAYDVYRCWPSVYRPVPALSAGDPVRLVESLTLVHDGWARDRSVFPA
jgi:phage tail-like protein